MLLIIQSSLLSASFTTVLLIPFPLFSLPEGQLLFIFAEWFLVFLVFFLLDGTKPLLICSTLAFKIEKTLNYIFILQQSSLGNFLFTCTIVIQKRRIQNLDWIFQQLIYHDFQRRKHTNDVAPLCAELINIVCL